MNKKGIGCEQSFSRKPTAYTNIFQLGVATFCISAAVPLELRLTRGSLGSLEQLLFCQLNYARSLFLIVLELFTGPGVRLMLTARLKCSGR